MQDYPEEFQSIEYDRSDRGYRYVYNHSTKQFLDYNRLLQSNCVPLIYPLVLLLAIGNGYGNGDILPNTRTWFKYGDGVNTFDEDIGSYEMPFHILKLNVTATNDTDKYQELCIFPILISFTSDNVPTPFENDENVPEGKKLRLCIRFGYTAFSLSELHFRKLIFIPRCYNNIISLKTDNFKFCIYIFHICFLLLFRCIFTSTFPVFVKSLYNIHK